MQHMIRAVPPGRSNWKVASDPPICCQILLRHFELRARCDGVVIGQRSPYNIAAIDQAQVFVAFDLIDRHLWRHLQAGSVLGQLPNGNLPAAIVGTREMAVPVTFSVLTTMVAFAPLLFWPCWPEAIASGRTRS